MPGLADDDEADLLEQAHDPSRRSTESSAITTRRPAAELRHGVAQRREVARQAVGQQLVDALGSDSPASWWTPRSRIS